MFKIKLLILLLINLTIISCTQTRTPAISNNFSIAYVSGEYDGLLLKNFLTNNLKSLNIYNQNSQYEVQSQIKHKKKIYITNIDNTSDRENITTTLVVKIVDKNEDCTIFKNNFIASQFYIYASSDQFISNQAAVKKIKKDNTEAVVKKFINKLDQIKFQCNG